MYNQGISLSFLFKINHKLLISWHAGNIIASICSVICTASTVIRCFNSSSALLRTSSTS